MISKRVYSFEKKRRLLKKQDYDFVFARANRLVTADFVVLFRQNQLGHTRLGLALSKKMIHKAHDRNRIKRVIREGFRQVSLPAIDIVFLARPGLAQQRKSHINATLSKLWLKLTAY